MDIEKLIEQYRQAADKWEKRNPITGTFDLRVQDALRDAATALSTLQAENKKLRAELEQVKRERDAAECDLKYLGDCVVCKYNKVPCLREDAGHKTCFQWRGIQTDSSPCLVADEATEFTKEQWAWLFNRFTKKED